MGHPGAPFERTVAEHYRKHGYRTIRSYASLGIWDLLCIRKAFCDIPMSAEDTLSHVIYVQVKGKESDPFTETDKAAIKIFAEQVGAHAHYAYGKRMPLKKKIPGSKRRLQKNRSVIIENLSVPGHDSLGSGLIDLPD